MEKLVCVVGEANADVREAAEELGMDIAVQEPQLGTGHAVLAAKDHFDGYDGTITVLYADTPLISGETLSQVFDAHDAGAETVVIGFETEEPAAYGRLVTDGETLTAIVEAKEATPEQLSITFCNSGKASSHSSVRRLLGGFESFVWLNPCPIELAGLSLLRLAMFDYF